MENLFFNTPVRYKFLKKDFTELGYVEDAVTRLALVNPQISVKLQSLGKTLVQTTGSGNIKDTVYSIYGKEIAENIINVDYQMEDMRVTGCIGKPEIAKANRTGQLFFVNGRFVKDKILTSAAEQAFKSLVPAGKYGFLILNLEIDSHQIDVNVHPAKLEIRFQEENKIFKLVYHAIKESYARFVENKPKEEEEDILELIKEGYNMKFDSKELERQRDYIYSKPEENTFTDDVPISHTGNLVEDLYNDRLRQHAIEDVSKEIAEAEGLINEEKKPEEDDGINYFEDVLKFQEELKKDEQAEAVAVKEEADVSVSSTTSDLVSKMAEITAGIDDIPIKNNLISIDTPENPKAETMEETENGDLLKLDMLPKIDDIQPVGKKSEEHKMEEKEAEDLNSSFEEMYRKTFGISPVEKKNEVNETEKEEKIKLQTAEDVKSLEYRNLYSNIKYKFVGIAFGKFIIIEIDNELYIVDQKATNERIIFEKLKKSYYTNGNRESQMMLLPDVIDVTSKQMDIARDNMLLLRKAGFEYEEFGENTIKLVGVPDVCIDLETKVLFVEILDEINKVARTSKDEIEEKFIATIAKSAAKNEKLALTFEEVDVLMKKLLILDKPFTSVDGTPTAIKFSQSEIEKKISK